MSPPTPYQYQLVWMGKTKHDLLSGTRVVMPEDKKLLILQDAAKNLWCPWFITPQQFIELLRVLGVPFLEGAELTTVCMRKVITAMDSLVCQANLGDGLMIDKSIERFSYTDTLREHILSSKTLAEAFDTPPNTASRHRKHRCETVAHHSRNALVALSIAQLELKGAFQNTMRITSRLSTVRSPALDMSNEYANKIKQVLKEARSDKEAERRLRKQFGISLKDVIRGQYKRSNVSDSSSSMDEDESMGVEMLDTAPDREDSSASRKIKNQHQEDDFFVVEKLISLDRTGKNVQEELSKRDTKSGLREVRQTKDEQGRRRTSKADEGRARQTKEEQTKEEQTKVEETKVEETKVEQTKEEQTKEEQTKEEQTKVEETKAEETKAEETKAEETKEEETKEEKRKGEQTKDKKVVTIALTADGETNDSGVKPADIGPDLFSDNQIDDMDGMQILEQKGEAGATLHR
ncbi:uncharacterized protein MYCGRDRAFT_111739 [Zymoseptoria tritici IPO323]|uniref:Uncharacterized protein n=1 Tax=Zymoseptoria tritici (strain CBS 115943 / IPO323) TaxID=336722 RepID=F9XQT1_ZYMTI|nr:uncharacterized protein MYCGRDRAFT_111739 [Zymoseptoria tritici IPO323]EGP82431.1 hypothetical protein MYCGRDRAFT_111739 [Zymoseptoria tritici IPO323]